MCVVTAESITSIVTGLQCFSWFSDKHFPLSHVPFCTSSNLNFLIWQLGLPRNRILSPQLPAIPFPLPFSAIPLIQLSCTTNLKCPGSSSSSNIYLSYTVLTVSGSTGCHRGNALISYNSNIPDHP